MEGTTIDLAVVRQGLERVLDALEAELGPQVVSLNDYYWSVPVPSVFAVTREKPELTVGQVSDDLEALQVLTEESEEILAWHELAHLRGVLLALEAAVNPSV